ncbi:ABC transporter ATP-binding protein [Myxococcus llanfairpwllgwyngyllgogerychwyrndrobwllllantysiliogogogochensis]|uniref:ABC transporter ATP-binding protein n=1 Tax=Myxococcus llanfairpwllgwyngyllgogerychwyrndrobwllllantysiliogogogochensis TaxID=2590453 RepID=A0A540X2G6_9BACT|nr:ABC transporter ATP-binding protein [Myxococcus llanfairpwllgwyngyllgogerychwyrndrobwllllantysiliogogogochensis]TQF15462.1 ABC transporter ATP-binding protein [Myxococcus llanfairpwllgwyngyllgogerychwyrndrobwllllantysiliogogogochensis]
MNPLSPDAPPIQVRGLSKTYKVGFWFNRTVRALQGLDLEVGAGQIYGLLGPNGAGKSTTIKILMNLVRPSSGNALLFGQPVDKAATRRLVGFLPENPAPYEYLTGREFVTLAGQLCGLSGHELDVRVKEVLGSVEMGAAEKLQIRRYSKGMVQRVALAQALVARPKMLILDEPTSGLDPVGRRQMRDLILAERDRGTTVLFCSHIIPDVEALCDRLAVLVGGRRVREGSVRELLSTQVPTVEMVVEGLPLEQVKSLGVALESTQSLDGRVRVQVPDAQSQKMLSQVLAAGGRVNSLQAAQFSLEQLFMDALKDSGRTTSVGGEINT